MRRDPVQTPDQAADGRLIELDVLRGFAVCGIILTNTWQKTGAGDGGAVDWALTNFFQSRFYPIFSFLFGLSFVLFLASAGNRTAWPRLVLLRRLIILAGFGLLHHILSPGEVLLPYALFGALVLLPASYLSRWLVLALGVVATVWAVRLGGAAAVVPFLHGAVWLIPAMFLLGMALMEYRPGPGWTAPAFVVSATAAAALLWWSHHSESAHSAVYAAGGLAAGAAYCTGLLLLLRTRLRELLTSVLAPLGRTALTSYLVSTPLILAAMPLLIADGSRWAGVVFALALVALLIAFSRWWLARFRYGPLEWLWRCGTWWRFVPIRRDR